MKIYEKYINQIYFDEIILGNKVHEYRLNVLPLNTAEEGDILRLVCRNENKDTIRCLITSKEVYPDFKSAISMYFHNDFSNLYENIDMAVDACNKFYKEEDIKNNGVLVLGIKFLNKEDI